MRKIEELTIQMSEMVRRHDEQVKAHEQRIISLERQPADQYGKIKMVIITAVVSGVIGSIITAIPVLIKQ